jgi:hypothetical protein
MRRMYLQFSSALKQRPRLLVGQFGKRIRPRMPLPGLPRSPRLCKKQFALKMFSVILGTLW